MKKYSVNVYYRIVLTVQVEAESQEEALRIAKESGEQMRSLNDYDFIETLDACVTDVEEARNYEDVDVDELMERAIRQMKDNDMTSVSVSGVSVTKTIVETSGGMMCDEHYEDYEVEEVYLEDDTLYVRYADPLYDSEDAPDDEPLEDLGTDEIAKILLDILN